MEADENEIEVQIFFGPDGEGRIIMLGAECCESTSCHDIWPITVRVPMLKVLEARPQEGSKRYFTHDSGWIQMEEEEE